MIFLADNDIILKFSCLGLHDFFVRWLSSRNACVSYLGTLPGQLRNNSKWKETYSAETLLRAQQLIERPEWSILGNMTDKTLLQTLTAIPGIDPGERVLYANLRDDAETIVLSGDKRCMKALAKAQLDDIYQIRIQKKTICFEQILESIINEQSFSKTLAAIIDFQGCDKTISILFSHGTQSSEGEVRRGLLSYINDLKKNAPGILVDNVQVD